MAIDTASRRASVLGFGLAFRLVLPVPDGTVGTEDRPHLAYSYAGIAASSPVVSQGILIVVPGEDRRIVIAAEDRRILVPQEGQL